MSRDHGFEPIWRLADYQRFLKHDDPYIRLWAADRIEEQYPNHAAESFIGLLADSDLSLQITAAQAIGDSGDKRYEAHLLAALSDSSGPARHWLLTGLGRLQAPTLLPQLLAQLADPPRRCPTDEARKHDLASLIEALGHYDDESARNLLWHFVENYKTNDRLVYLAFAGLLRFAEPTTVSRLIDYYNRLRVREDQDGDHALLALAAAGGVSRLTRAFIETMVDGPDATLWLLSSWFEVGIDYSKDFEAAIYQTAPQKYDGFLPVILAEFEHAATKRGDDLAGWLADWRSGAYLSGYGWRMVYAHQLISVFVANSPKRKASYQEAVALCLSLLAQALIDQDDDAQLQSAHNELIRQSILLNILGSPRENVWPELIDHLTSLGQGMVPHLLQLLEGAPYWAMLRALEVLTRLARQYPGAADEAVSVLLDLIQAEQGEGILEAAVIALKAIGSAAIIPAAMRLGRVDYVYDIYVTNLLAGIPTSASVQALLSYLTTKRTLEDFEADALADLGHSAALAFLRDRYDWTENIGLCIALYKLAALNGYDGPEFETWQAAAQTFYTTYLQDWSD